LEQLVYLAKVQNCESCEHHNYAEDYQPWKFVSDEIRRHDNGKVNTNEVHDMGCDRVRIYLVKRDNFVLSHCKKPLVRSNYSLGGSRPSSLDMAIASMDCPLEVVCLILLSEE